MVNLIKELNDSLKPKDPIETAIAEAMETTQLHDDQIEMLADYMREMIDGAKKRGVEQNVQDAAGMALEDVAGFETASRKVLQSTIARLVRAYEQKYSG